MTELPQFKPGDVLAVGTRDKAGAWIRLRSWLQRQPSKQNHIVMFTHYDEEMIPRGLEGRPSGFGWVNLERYKGMPFVTNAGKTDYDDASRQVAVNLAKKMIGTPYDWRAIITLGLDTLGYDFVLSEWPEEGLPSHVTCASSLDLVHESLDWPNPMGWRKTRGTDVDDWVRHIQRQWLSPHA